MAVIKANTRTEAFRQLQQYKNEQIDRWYLSCGKTEECLLELTTEKEDVIAYIAK